MSNVLVIYEMVPEDTRMFLVPEDVYEKHNIDKANGRMINANHFDDALEKVLHLVTLPQHMDSHKPFSGAFLGYEVLPLEGKPITENISKVVYTGIVL